MRKRERERAACELSPGETHNGGPAKGKFGTTCRGDGNQLLLTDKTPLPPTTGIELWSKL